MNVTVVGHYRPDYALAYYFDWRDAFLECGAPGSVRVINTWRPGRRPLALYERLPAALSLPTRQLRRLYAGEDACDVLVFAPSFFYFNRGQRGRHFERLAARGSHRFSTVFFMENEYRLLEEKVGLARRLGAQVLASQLPPDHAQALYSQRFDGRIVSCPAALNPNVFKPTRPLAERAIHIGTRSHRYPEGLGDDLRNRVLDRFASAEGPLAGFHLDVVSDESARLSRVAWAGFLNECRATVGTEAGAARLSWAGSAGAQVSGKAVSSRHFEAMGTRTAQLLTPGRYNDMLQPGEHYIALGADFGNLQEVADAVRDLSYLENLTRRALEHALSAHTYAHRVRALLRSV
jgi:hypothetical protein